MIKSKKIYNVYHKTYDENDSPCWTYAYSCETEEIAKEKIKGEIIPQFFEYQEQELYYKD